MIKLWCKIKPVIVFNLYRWISAINQTQDRFYKLWQTNFFLPVGFMYTWNGRNDLLFFYWNLNIVHQKHDLQFTDEDTKHQTYTVLERHHFNPKSIQYKILFN